MSFIYKVPRDLAVLKSNITLSATFTTSSGTVEICFGDGSTQTSNTPSNTYTKVQPYLINVLSDKSLVTGITFNNQSLTSVSVEEIPNVTTLDIRNNLLNNSQISQILIELDENGQSSGSLQIDGNPYTEISAEAQVALGNLGTKGWTTDVVWTPAYVTTDAWYDSNDTATITESGGAVSQWDDKSGNGYHLTQGTGANQPTLVTTTGATSNPAVQFDSNDTISNTSFNLSLTEYTILMVAETNDSATGNRGLFYMKNTGDTNYATLWQRLFNYQYRLYTSIGGTVVADDGVNPGTGALPEQFMLGAKYDGANATMTRDGTDDTPVALTGTMAVDELTLGKTIDLLSTTHWTPNYISEVVIIEDSSVATQQKIEGYLAHKWGFTGLLPAGHPYKTTGPTV